MAGWEGAYKPWGIHASRLVESRSQAPPTARIATADVSGIREIGKGPPPVVIVTAHQKAEQILSSPKKARPWWAARRGSDGLVELFLTRGKDQSIH